MTKDKAELVALDVLSHFFKEMQEKTRVVEEEEEGEDLCNCEFSLAYGMFSDVFHQSHGSTKVDYLGLSHWYLFSRHRLCRNSKPAADCFLGLSMSTAHYVCTTAGHAHCSLVCHSCTDLWH